ENARRNGANHRIEADVTPLADLGGTYDVVVANIEARVLAEIAKALGARVRAGGVLILSGILIGQETDVARAFGSFVVKDAPVESEWIALILEPRPFSL